MLKLRINPNFKPFIHQSLTNSKKIKHTHRIVGRNLLINSEDLEEVGKVFERLELKFRF